MMTLKVNGHDHQIDAEPETPLLYVLRDELSSTRRNSVAGWVNAALAP
jgi:aerobic-type carbon monoxide dehydrogenase small subunit (CoxS/CutS family)